MGRVPALIDRGARSLSPGAGPAMNLAFQEAGPLARKEREEGGERIAPRSGLRHLRTRAEGQARNWSSLVCRSG